MSYWKTEVEILVSISNLFFSNLISQPAKVCLRWVSEWIANERRTEEKFGQQQKIEFFFQPTVQTLDYKIAYGGRERLKGLKAVCTSSNKSWKKQNQCLLKTLNNILILILICEYCNENVLFIGLEIFLIPKIFCLLSLFLHFKTSFLL